MTNELDQHITVEESMSIQWVKPFIQSEMFCPYKMNEPYR